MITTAVELRNITKAFPGVLALDDVSISIAEGSCHALVGENGAGKSTLGKILAGLYQPDAGEIVLFGKAVKFSGPLAAAEAGVAIVHQELLFCENLTVEENLKVGTLTRRGVNLKEELDRIYHYFPRLAELRHRLAGYCSGGEQQMIAIGRALLAKPRLLLLDEPSLGLAPLLVREIFDIVARVNAEEGVTVLVVEQNARVALSIAHYGYIMESGRIVLEGDRAYLLENPDVQEFYLGVAKEGGRKSFKEVKAYKRRKRFM